MSFFSKRFEYDTHERGSYEITSPGFSKEYSIKNNKGEMVASFAKTSSWIQSGAYHLQNNSDLLDSFELVAVVMGVHSIHKNQQINAGTM
jgi:hypothetical protein